MNNLLPNVEPNTLKDKIIYILSYKFPLSISSLKKEIKKQFDLGVSYQAIHKIIKDLERTNIVDKKEGLYLLDVNWIKKVNYFSEQILLNYSKIKKYSLNILNQLKKDGDMITLKFESISELDNYFVEVMGYFNQLLKPNEKVIMHYRHNWWPLLYSKKEDDINRESKNNQRFFCLCGSNNYLDVWCTNFENSIGMNVKYKENAAQNGDLQVYSDIVVQFYIDTNILKTMDDFFTNIKSTKELDLKKLLEILHMHGKINVILHKNKFIAEQIKEETLNYFK